MSCKQTVRLHYFYIYFYQGLLHKIEISAFFLKIYQTKHVVFKNKNINTLIAGFTCSTWNTALL